MALSAPLLLPQNELTGTGAATSGYDFAFTQSVRDWKGGLPFASPSPPSGTNPLPIVWTARQLWLYAATQGFTLPPDSVDEEAYRVNHFRVWPAAKGYAGAAGALLRLPKIILCDFGCIEHWIVELGGGQLRDFGDTVFSGLETALADLGVAVWHTNPLDGSYDYFAQDPFFGIGSHQPITGAYDLAPAQLLPHSDFSLTTDTGGASWAPAVGTGSDNEYTQPWGSWAAGDWLAGEVLYLSAKTFQDFSTPGLLGDGLLSIHLAYLETVNLTAVQQAMLQAAIPRHLRFGYHAVLDLNSAAQGANLGFDDLYWLPFRAKAVEVWDGFFAAAGPETQDLILDGGTVYSDGIDLFLDPVAVAQAAASFRARMIEFWGL